MAMSTGGGGGVNSEINVTPMIDVLLVLLIIFMVVIALGRTAVQIQIPPTDTATKNTDVRARRSCSNCGTTAATGSTARNISKADLGTGIKKIFDPRPAKLLFLKPGQNRIYADVINAVDVARGAGVEVIGVTPIEAN